MRLFGRSAKPAPHYPLELVRGPHWFALRTRSRAEKKTDSVLRAAGVESFAAVADMERTWADRTRRVGMPLFPGYIFVRIALRDVNSVLQWPGAVDLVRDCGVPKPLRDEEMDAVFCLVRGVSETGQLPDQAEYPAAGDLVRVTGGPFQGMEGILVEERGTKYVAVRLEAIRQARAVQVARELLARVRPPGQNVASVPSLS